MTIELLEEAAVPIILVEGNDDGLPFVSMGRIKQILIDYFKDKLIIKNLCPGCINNDDKRTRYCNIICLKSYKHVRNIDGEEFICTCTGYKEK
jgi:hypothetical protein